MNNPIMSEPDFFSFQPDMPLPSPAVLPVVDLRAQLYPRSIKPPSSHWRSALLAHKSRDTFRRLGGSNDSDLQRGPGTVKHAGYVRQWDPLRGPAARPLPRFP